MRSLFLLLLIVPILSCTRGANTSNLEVSIGMPEGQGGLDTDDRLGIVIVNVKVPGRGPIVREIEYHEGQIIVMGQPINLEITDIPNGDGFFVQVLAVYESQTNGTMKFLYGDATTAVRGETTVNITADNAGSSNIMVRVAGRYLTDQAADVGPTGEMIAQFLPPNWKPAMNVKRDYIVNGWFQAFSIDSATAGFRYVLTDGTVVFSELKESSAILSPNDKILKVIKPVSFRRENRGSGSSIRVSPLTYFYLGHFNVTDTRNTCFVDMVEGVPGMFTDATLATPMVWGGTFGTSADIRTAAGGSSEVSYGVFAENGTTCTQANIDIGTALLFHHFKADDEEGFAGFSVPYRSMRPFDMHRSFLTAELDVSNSANPIWAIKWDYLPGSEAGLAGTEIFYKVQLAGGGGEDTRSCESLSKSGYSSAGETLVNSANPEKFDFSGRGLVYDNANPSNSNVFNYRFLACAFRMVNGTKQYLGRPAQGDCLSSNCGAFDHFGWGTDNLAPGSVNFALSMDGASQRITAVTSAGNYDEVSFASDTGFLEGFEAMVIINGAAGTSPCGSYQGRSLNVGDFAFTRILEVSSTSMRVAKGTFLEVMGTAALANSPDSNNFCYAQIVQVPHYHDLDLGGSTITTSSFDYAGTGGGIIVFRVNGTLNLGATGNGIDLTAAGYPGGSSVNANGGGDRRAPSATSVVHSGGVNNGSSRSGGGGYSNGGNANGGSVMPGQGLGMVGGGMQPRLIMGGGGAGSGTPGFGFGNGGGIALILANQVTSFGGFISSKGSGGSSYSGGGGGSVNLVTRQLTGNGTGSVAFEVYGGDGSSATGSFGGGGGGSAQIWACQNDLVTSTTFSPLGGLGGGTTTAGGNGSTGHAAYSSITDFWMCR